MRARMTATGLALLWTGAVIASAQAHIVLKEPTAAAGAYYVATFRVTHGCAGSPTVALRVSLPEGITTAKPMPRPGWRIEINRAPLAVPVTIEGRTLTDRPTEIVWSGGPLPDAWFDEFSISLKLPAEVGTLRFPVVQVCETGETRWTDVPPEGKTTRDVRYPAPTMTLTPPPAARGHAH